jgi:large subunit ribosomal protein L4
MAEVPLLGGARDRAVKLDDEVFGARFNEALIHESVRAEQAARRKGTAATRTRGMVSGGGAKPWRQKGTGRARAGSIRSPLWTGGGTAFGPHPRSYTFKVNRRERRAALRGALSLHAGRDSLAVLDGGVLGEPKTRRALEVLEEWGAERPTLVILEAEESSARLSFRNLEAVSVIDHRDVGVSDLLAAASLIISRPALEALTARAASPPRSAGRSNVAAHGEDAPAAESGGPQQESS